ncbi:HAD family hydrolase [Thermaurantiacus sp.]
MSPRPCAVVFDVGHVLYEWDIRHLYARLISDPAELDWFLANVVTRAWHVQHDAGRPFAETSAELVKQFPDQAERIRAYGPRWLETIPGPVPGMPELVLRLADAGVPLYAITNFSAEFWAMFRPTAPVFDHFKDIIVSGEERLMKPDPAIFALASTRFGLGPGEALFVDDQPANVAAAQAAGWLGHRFTDCVRLEAELSRLGFLPEVEAPAATP